MTTPLAIDCQHLTHRYGHFTAVDDLTFTVAPGRAFCRPSTMIRSPA